MKHIVISFLIGSLVLFSWPGLAHANDGEYLSIEGPCDLVFPRDHGAHPGYRLEWWYYTGNLRTGRGARYGFQLTFFRTQISPPGHEKAWPPGKSAWRTNQVYIGHAASAALDKARFYQEEKIARGAVGLAGVEPDKEGTRVFLGSWSATMAPGKHRLKAAAERFGLDLLLSPAKPPVLHGIRGYSQKGERPTSASCYYSLTRLATSGTLNIDGESVRVRGWAWMDHEFSSAPLEENLTGWDWFSIQLEDETELMIYLLRKEDHGYSGASSGTFIERSGKSYHLDPKDFQVEVLNHWKSERSGALYPSRWRIRVFSKGLDLSMAPNMADQELITERTSRVTYWEGSVSVKGRHDEKPVEGVGYVEMTGYGKPFRLGSE